MFKLIHLPLCIDAKDLKKAEQLFLDLVHSVRQDDIFSALKAKQAVLNLLCYYLECCPPDSVSLVAQSFDSPLSDAIAYVETHLNQQITVQQMAEAAGYHVSHFTRLFQSRMGIQKKTETATQLLTSTDLSIASIADSLGFGSQFYFSNFFKKQTGMTPSSYRRLYLRAYLES